MITIGDFTAISRSKDTRSHHRETAVLSCLPSGRYTWTPNVIYENLVRQPPATFSARSVTGCDVLMLDLLHMSSPTRDDETRHIDGSVHVTNLKIRLVSFLQKNVRNLYVVAADLGVLSALCLG